MSVHVFLITLSLKSRNLERLTISFYMAPLGVCVLFEIEETVDSSVFDTPIFLSA